MSDWKDCTTSEPSVALDLDRCLDASEWEGLIVPPQLGTVDLPELPEDCGIRETLLWRFRDPEDEVALRRLGGMLTELVNESGQFGPEHPGGPAHRRGASGPERLHGARAGGFSLPREELRAVALDLFYSARFLSEVAAERFASELTGDEIRLAEQSDRWAAHATVVAVLIWDALGELRPDAPS
jgi:hypothetical protein